VSASADDGINILNDVKVKGEIRLKMAEQRAKIEEKLGEPITPVAEKKE
jgi:hypothetical protein